MRCDLIMLGLTAAAMSAQHPASTSRQQLLSQLLMKKTFQG